VTVRDKDREAFKDALDDAKAIIGKAKDEDRDLTTDEKDEVDKLTSAAEAAKARIETDAKDDTLALRLAALMGGDAAKSDEATPEPKSPGEAFSAGIKSWMQANATADGQLPESFKNFRTPSIESKFINVATIGPAFPGYEDRRGVLVNEPWPIGYEALIAMLSRGTVSSPVVHYAVEDWTNAADWVAEATSVATGAKPQSDVTYTPATANVGTIAHWVVATKQALADVGLLRSLIDNGLRRGILAKIGQTVLAGDGAAPEPFGLNTLATVPAQAYATSPLVTVKNAISALEAAGFPASGVVMNNADWNAIDQSTPSVVTDPLSNRAKVIGGVPVVTVPTQPVGFAMVGDFKQAFLLDREQSTITATDSHADFFIRNLVAILGEWRGVFFVPNPGAFRKADLTP
jgi:hypothetical protein